MSELEQHDGSEIAVVGMSCRFPGAFDTREYWNNLRNGKESIRVLADDELEAPIDDRSVGPYIKAGSFLEGIELFDAHFFGISPAEARVMDPQHRMFLECAWEAFEDAGYHIRAYPGRVGVFAGARTNTYLLRLATRSEIVKDLGAFQLGLGNDLGFLTTRVSYKLNLRGPSYAVQSACSTALAAVHLACQSLLIDECELALAGGVAVSVPHKVGYVYEDGSIFSPDGHCRAFDDSARGTVFGSGVGAVVMKKLSDAIRDNDRIYAIIRGSAANNDGALKANFSSPSVQGQTTVILDALASAGVNAKTISYLEAHGTGTQLGDPIEVRALEKAFRNHSDAIGYCALGSVKTNLGHLDAAAGIASLIKVILALYHGEIPPSLHCNTPNRQIDFSSSPFYVNSELRAWPTKFPRRAGVSSFGIGGTNVHIILEGAPHLPVLAQRLSGRQLLPISAKTAPALSAMANRLAAFLEANTDIDLANVAYTLQVGRCTFPFRRVITASTTLEAIANLRTDGPIQEADGDPELMFVLSGDTHTSLSYMGGLYEGDPVFRSIVDDCADFASQHFAFDIRSYFDTELPFADQKQDNRAAQLALFSCQYALGKLWIEWGVRPVLLTGVGCGELVAACLSGILELEAALRVLTTKSFDPGYSMCDLAVATPSQRIISSRTGEWLTPEQACDVNYWCELLSADQSVEKWETKLLDQNPRILLEVGPSDRISNSFGQSPTWTVNTVILPSLTRAEGGPMASMVAAAAKLWEMGVGIDWKRIQRNDQARRISLPTYPFERQRHWVEAISPSASGVNSQSKSQTAKLSKTVDTARWFYVPSWKRVALAAAATAPLQTRRVLLFGDVPFSNDFSSYLRERANTVIRVSRGEEFRAISDYSFVINPSQASDYRLLLDKIAHLWSDLDLVLYMWSLDSEIQPGEPSWNRFRQLQDHTFLAPTLLMQALALQKFEKPIDIWLISNHSGLVEDGDCLIPEKSITFPLCRAAAQESERISFRSIDIKIPQQRELVDRLAATIYRELSHQSRANVIAVRGEHRWVAAFEPLALLPSSQAGRKFRDGGVYIITGGHGAIGLLLAEYLARFHAHLILIGRTAIPNKATWNTLGEEDRKIHKIVQALKNIEISGATIMTISADVAEESEMSNAVERVREIYGRIDGVIHAAGITSGDSVFQSFGTLNADQAELQFRPKVAGVFILERVFRTIPLDFIMLFSSNAAVLGGLGLASYSAANAFMDAFASYRLGKNGTPWISVNWDQWPDETKHYSGYQTSVDQFTLTTTEALEAFERAVEQAPPGQLVISTGDLIARCDRWTGLQESNLNSIIETQLEYPREDVFVPPSTETELLITTLWEGILGVKGIGVNDSFFDLGGDTLVATRLLARIFSTLAVEVPLGTFLESPTIHSLALSVQEIQDGLSSNPVVSS